MHSMRTLDVQEILSLRCTPHAADTHTYIHTYLHTAVRAQPPVENVEVIGALNALHHHRMHLLAPPLQVLVSNCVCQELRVDEALRY